MLFLCSVNIQFKSLESLYPYLIRDKKIIKLLKIRTIEIFNSLAKKVLPIFSIFRK